MFRAVLAVASDALCDTSFGSMLDQMHSQTDWNCIRADFAVSFVEHEQEPAASECTAWYDPPYYVLFC